MNIYEIEKVINSFVPSAIMCKPTVGYHIATNAGFIDKNQINQIVNDLVKISDVEKVDIINQYINIKFKKNSLLMINFDNNIGKNKIINVEYCSANPTGPLHLGHLRSTIYGASVARLLKLANFDITTDFYVNNGGVQFDSFVNSIRHYHNPEVYKECLYKGEYVKEYANNLKHDFKHNELCATLVSTFKNQLKNRFDIMHDRYIYENDQIKNTEEIIDILKAKGYIYIGKIENQKSEHDLMIIHNLINCENFVIARLINNEWKYTYAGLDIGYSYGKYKEGYLNQICCVGEDHIGHIQKMNNIMKCINENINLKVIYTGIVKFELNDNLVKMSKRNGNFITIESIFENNIHRNALIQTVFAHVEHKPMTISIDNINENEIFVVSYMINKIVINDYIDDQLAMFICQWPYILKSSVNSYSIHNIYEFVIKICKYLHENQISSVSKQIFEIIENCIYILGIKK